LQVIDSCNSSSSGSRSPFLATYPDLLRKLYAFSVSFFPRILTVSFFGRAPSCCLFLILNGSKPQYFLSSFVHATDLPFSLRSKKRFFFLREPLSPSRGGGLGKLVARFLLFSRQDFLTFPPQQKSSFRGSSFTDEGRWAVSPVRKLLFPQSLCFVFFFSI